MLHGVVTGPGSPSSVTTADNATAVVGSVMIWSAPAWTTGARLKAPLTSMVTSSLVTSSPSLAVSVSTYVPIAEKVTLEPGAVASPKATRPGPLVLLHWIVSGVPVSTPSSLTTPLSALSAGSVTV